MHWTTHLMTGAALGYLIGRPLPAAAAGFALHPVLDITPHHDPDSDLGYVVDSAAGCSSLVLLLGSRNIRRSDAGKAAIWGALGAGLPDVELLAKLFWHARTEDYIFPWHNGSIPHNQTHLRGSTVLQVTLVALGLLLALRKSRRRGPSPAAGYGRRHPRRVKRAAGVGESWG